MYYEVYVDVLFVENLWVNVCLLLLTSRLMGYQTDRKRIAAGAALGSMGACLLETGSAYLTTAGWFLGTILTAAAMVRTAYGKRNTYIKCLVVLYLEGWLLGGTVRYLEQFYVPAGLMLAGGSMVLAGILLAVEWVLVKLREREDIICPVALYLGGGIDQHRGTCGYRKFPAGSCERSAGQRLYGTGAAGTCGEVWKRAFSSTHSLSDRCGAWTFKSVCAGSHGNYHKYRNLCVQASDPCRHAYGQQTV